MLVFRAVAFGGTGDWEAALREYQKAARVQSDNPTAFQVKFIAFIVKLSLACRESFHFMSQKAWKSMLDIIQL